ncbi:alpha-amylase-domain-containing protein [Pleurotus eryngii]|uniref:Alpha-amylase n=1 Tax=Pleurotus eryngii TaxID=5323 RepID=A0A9P6D5G8_PLEER|nr:alpha-amylase-domain-containing protein [Pleurotus eryngii]
MAISITFLYLLAAIALNRVGATPLANTPTDSEAATPDLRHAEKTVIIQLFQWNWESVGDECERFIGPAGYGYVQVSPPNEHIPGNEWWRDYQPVSYKIESKRGNRAQFAQMVTKCHTAGVKVITDTLFNHMSAIGSGTGTDGSSFKKYDYPGLYTYSDFHHNCGTQDNIIHNFASRKQVQNCELLGLADLDTGSASVQAHIVEYATDLRSLGVDGFRLDAAKHVPSNDLKSIMSRVPGFGTPSLYVTQEVVGGTSSDNSEVKAAEYMQNGDVQVFEYTKAVRDAFVNGNLAGLRELGHGWIPSAKANVFVVNHDRERDGPSEALNANSPSNMYILGHVFSLAHPYGHVSVLSSYEEGLGNKDAGAPNQGRAKCTGAARDGNGGWICQHRWTAIAGMTRFRNAVQDAPLENWQSPRQDRIAFSRGKAGFVAINNSDGPWSATLNTGLPKGSYCNVVSGAAKGGKCTGPTLEVDADGKLATTIPARSAAGIHVGEVEVGGAGGIVGVAPSYGQQNSKALHKVLLISDRA